jgi:cytochrome c peroxidase
MQFAHLIKEHYQEQYEAIFGALPELSRLPRKAGPTADDESKTAWSAISEGDRDAVSRVFANMGKAIAAYERKLVPGRSRFDAYVGALQKDKAQASTILTNDEVAGLRLFIGKANCTQCHNGPLFTNNDFHNTGVPAASERQMDRGRSVAIAQVLNDEFNCLSKYSDAKPEQCGELRFLADDAEALRQFRPPSLRNVAERAPYMHAGQLTSLAEVIDHYNRAPQAPLGRSQLVPLHLTKKETYQLIAFLRTLSAPLQTEQQWLTAPTKSAVAVSHVERRLATNITSR